MDGKEKLIRLAVEISCWWDGRRNVGEALAFAELGSVRA